MASTSNDDLRLLAPRASQAAAVGDGGSSSTKPTKKSDGAASKEEVAPRRGNKKRSSSSGDVSDGQEEKKQSSSSKRRRHNRPRHRIPEARFVQSDDEWACISDSDDNEQPSRSKSYIDFLPYEVRRDIARYTRVFTPTTHPQFFVTVNRNNRIGRRNRRQGGEQGRGEEGAHGHN